MAQAAPEFDEARKPAPNRIPANTADGSAGVGHAVCREGRAVGKLAMRIRSTPET